MTIWGVEIREWPYALRDAGRQTLRDKVFGPAASLTYFSVLTLVYDLYVRYLGHYSSIYGLFGDLLAFLLWLWMFNIAVLGGVELNLVLDARREEAGAAEASGAKGAPAQRAA